MNTIQQMPTYAMPFTLQDFVRVISTFSIQDKLYIEQILEKDTLRYRAELLSKRIAPNDITMDEIVEEVKAVRNERNTK